MITPSTEELRMYVDSIPHREQVVPSGWRGTPPARINPKHLAAFSKAQQLDSALALDELSHVDAVPVSRIAEKGIDIEHALANGSSPYHEEG
ncbi:hypothetical protein E4U31_002756 [Claviceps sp. LM219 group G6]|nr:hypothetical protein E4U31_002756 [Claviceps sp. LM219 group G6]